MKNYDPKKIIVTIAGSAMEGFADGSFVTAARNNDSFVTSTGADGEGTRAQSNDTSGTVTLTLLQTSASNDILSAALAADELSGNGVFSMQIKDLFGTTLVSAETAYVQKPAGVEFARVISDRVWVIATPKLDMVVGGALSI